MTNQLTNHVALRTDYDVPTLKGQIRGIRGSLE